MHGPYHAAHLYGKRDNSHILGTSNKRVASTLNRYSLQLPIMSTSTGAWFSDKMTTTEVLSEIINDILNEPLRLYEVLNGCTRAVTSSKASKCMVIAFGPTAAEATFVTALKSETNVDVVLNQDEPESLSLLRLNQTPRTSKKQKLAIVGMAGRFPDAADHEKFWNLLLAGLDVHREVSSSYEIPGHSTNIM